MTDLSQSDSFRPLYERIAVRVSRRIPGCLFDPDEVKAVLVDGGSTGTVDGDRLILEEAREYGLGNVPDHTPMTRNFPEGNW